MVKLADIEPLIWLIIFVVVAVAKGWSKLQQSTDDDSSATDEPPLIPPRPQAPPPRPRLQPRPAVPPTARPAVRPRQPATARPTPPRVPVPVRGERKVDVERIRRLVEELGGKPQPLPPVRAPVQPVAKAEPPPPPPMPEPAPSATAAPQTIADAPAPPQRPRSSQWMEALRDRQNIRNIIIAAEIIGPPKAESA